MTSTRLQGYELIKPLLFVDVNCESPNLGKVKAALAQRIDSLKKSGGLISASVYLRVEHSQWTGINIDEPYHPGSLFKVPILMAYLRMAENDPNLLERSFVYEPLEKKGLPVQNYVFKAIEVGKKYTVRELLRYAVTYSDNNAYWLLTQHMDTKILENLFTDLGISVPNMQDAQGQILMSARDYSCFMKTLFNSTYVNPELSEFAMGLLVDSQFKVGLLAGLPKGTKVAHKFGERDDGHTFELHESGIVYLKNRAYLVTIMTKGTSREVLPGVVASLSKLIYENLQGS